MTTETPMRERIARAIYDAKGHFSPWSQFTDPVVKQECYLYADAVLDAMREPSAAQLRAAQKAHDEWGRSRSMLLRDLFNDIWCAMLDAAKEGK